MFYDGTSPKLTKDDAFLGPNLYPTNLFPLSITKPLRFTRPGSELIHLTPLSLESRSSVQARIAGDQK